VCLFHPPLLAARQRLGKGKIVVPTPAQSQASSAAVRKEDDKFAAWVDKQMAAYYQSGQTQKWYEEAWSVSASTQGRAAGHEGMLK
jgi:polar amino acid transport system substrate-binding protein